MRALAAGGVPRRHIMAKYQIKGQGHLSDILTVRLYRGVQWTTEHTAALQALDEALKALLAPENAATASRRRAAIVQRVRRIIALDRRIARKECGDQASL